MLTGALAAVDGLDLGSAAMRSPVMPLLRFPLGTAFAVLAAHERRHLAQARRVTEAPGFRRRDGGTLARGRGPSVDSAWDSREGG